MSYYKRYLWESTSTPYRPQIPWLKSHLVDSDNILTTCQMELLTGRFGQPKTSFIHNLPFHLDFMRYHTR